tara:strand:+ start:112 stop:399 length:288 start_codon:yes stop_codon:yes gene_type:complete
MNEIEKKCYWCENKTDMPYTYYSMGPISEKYELLIEGFKKKYGQEWWSKEKEIGKKIMSNIMDYDQITNTVSKGIVCADCLDKDNELYNKFRKNE